jgi:ribosomal-protein-alanine N-acetyltransferase
MSSSEAAVVAPSTEPVDVTLAPMRRRHLRAVLRIEEQAVHRSWSLGLFMNELAMKGSRRYVVAKVSGQVVGFAGLLFSGPDGHVTTISVDPAWQGHRVGTRLLLVLARAAVEQGSENLTLEVRAGNEPAIRLYRRFGFAPAGIRRGYYAEIGEDALVMWAHEIDGDDYRRRLDAIEAAMPGATELEEVGW